MKIYIFLALLCAIYGLEEPQPQQPLHPHSLAEQQQTQLSESGKYYPFVQQQTTFPIQRSVFSYVTIRPQYQDVQKSLNVEQNQGHQQCQQSQYDHVMGRQPQIYPQLGHHQQEQAPYHTQITTHQIIISEVRQLVPQYSGTTIVSIPTNMMGDKVNQSQQHDANENKSPLEGSNVYQRKSEVSGTIQNKFTPTFDSRADQVTDQYTSMHKTNVVTGRTPQHVVDMLQQQQQLQQQLQQQQLAQDENMRNTRNRRAISESGTTTITTKTRTSNQPPSTSSTKQSTTQSPVTSLVQKQPSQSAQREFKKNLKSRRAVSATGATTTTTTTSTQSPLTQLEGGHSMAQSRAPHLLHRQQPLSKEERRSRAMNSPVATVSTTRSTTTAPFSNGQHMNPQHKLKMAVKRSVNAAASTTTSATTNTSSATSTQ